MQLQGADAFPLHWQILADRTIAEGDSSAPVVVLPRDLANGVFRLHVTARTAAGDRKDDASLILASTQAYQGNATAPRRMWALAVQLYGIRSRRNWGHGDFSDLLGLIDLAVDLGASGIGLNPLHALFDDRAELASPYSPNTRLFLNPLYVDVEALPEFSAPQGASLRTEVENL